MTPEQVERICEELDECGTITEAMALCEERGVEVSEYTTNDWWTREEMLKYLTDELAEGNVEGVRDIFARSTCDWDAPWFLLDDSFNLECLISVADNEPADFVGEVKYRLRFRHGGM